jgi:hypothetical protein
LSDEIGELNGSIARPRSRAARTRPGFGAVEDREAVTGRIRLRWPKVPGGLNFGRASGGGASGMTAS